MYKKAAIGIFGAGPLAELVDGSFSVHYVHKDKKNSFLSHIGKIANFYYSISLINNEKTVQNAGEISK